MGGVPVKHHTRSKVGRRRSHIALKRRDILRCDACGGPTLAHTICPQCGARNKKGASSARNQTTRHSTPQKKTASE